jgi:hypothetical protein
VAIFGQSELASQNLHPWSSVLNEQSDEDEEELSGGTKGRERLNASKSQF